MPGDAGSAFVLGFVPTASAVLSLGPQNIFVLHRGLSRTHVAATVAVCFGSDMVLMSLAVLGFATVLDAVPFVAPGLRAAGCLYLAAGAVRMLVSAWRGDGCLAAGGVVTCLWRTVLGAAAVSLLNPLAWSESVLVVGGLAATLETEVLAAFTLGAFAGSLLKFLLLGFGARRAAFLLAHPNCCRAFDAAAAAVMAGMVLVLL